MAILLPDAVLEMARRFADPAIVKGGVQAIIQSLPGNALEFIVAGSGRVHRQNRSIRGQHPAPGIFVIVLLAAHRHAIGHTGEIGIDKIDERPGVLPPVGIDGLFLFNEIARQIQRRPGRAVVLFLVIFEKLHPEQAIALEIGKLII